jgi:hypothetical protein
MLAILAFLFGLTGGAFASPFHGIAAPGGVAPPTAPVRFDGTSGNPDNPLPPPPPGPNTTTGVVWKTGAPVRFDGTSGNPDHH